MTTDNKHGLIDMQLYMFRRVSGGLKHPLDVYRKAIIKIVSSVIIGEYNIPIGTICTRTNFVIHKNKIVYWLVLSLFSFSIALRFNKKKKKIPKFAINHVR